MSAYIERRFPGVAVPIVDINCRCFTSQFAAFATHPRRWGYCLLFMGRLWQGRHNSRTPCETCVPGFPPSPWEAVRKYHCAPCRSMRPGCRSSLQGICADRSDSLSYVPPFTSCRPGGAPYSAAAWFSYPQYRIFSFQGSRKIMRKKFPSPYNGQVRGKIQPSLKKFFRFFSDGRNTLLYVLIRKATFPRIFDIGFSAQNAIPVNIKLIRS